ncbi:MAG: PilZ domain-containing protein [Halobacteriota archaeon]|nr:PilZ domain-containing protein [Halobacteriota archaeon]
MVDSERRSHRRLIYQLPVQWSPVDRDSSEAHGGRTRNVGSGGVYFETESDGLTPGSLCRIELTVPPGEGHFPYPGHVRGIGEVVRVDRIEGSSGNGNAPRFGVAARFREPLKLLFVDQ